MDKRRIDLLEILYTSAMELERTFLQQIDYGKSFFGAEDITAYRDFCFNLYELRKYEKEKRHGQLEEGSNESEM